MRFFLSGLFAVLLLATALFLLLPEKPSQERVTIDIPVAPSAPAGQYQPFDITAVLEDALPEDEAAPDLEDALQAESLPAEIPPPIERWVVHEVQPGETLSAIFSNLEISKSLLYTIVNADSEEKSLSNLRPGQRLLFRFDDENDVLNLLIQEIDEIKSVHFTVLDGKTVTSKVEEKLVEKRVETAQGTIQSSLFFDGQRAGLSDRTIIEMAGLFNYDIDFGEIQAGDYFGVIYESRYIDGEFLGSGDILAAEFTHKNKSYRIVRFENKDRIDYLDEKGRSRKKAFIRTPLNFRRISSKFTNARFHPVLKRWRSHKGVDYAASTGTPVWATGNGTVKVIERQRGYGKVIYLQHGKKYTTVYGHLNAFKKGLKRGDKVKQGEVIGYVGQTGLATGPHLHYEFRVNGKHVDPLSHKLPIADPISGKQLVQFRQQADPLLQQLDQLKAPTLADNQ